MNSLLARFAENLFWLARYMERAENLARLLDVTKTFVRDGTGGQDWLAVLEINTDEDRFLESYETVTARNIISFYVSDKDNVTSITSSVRAARENARSLRHLISTEMWGHLNGFYNALSGLRRSDLTVTNLSNLCDRIKQGCQTHAGITDGTLYRDQVWCFYRIGKYLERADQMSRLIDIKYQHLQMAEAEFGSPIDASQWSAVLRSVAGYQAFRRTHPRGMKADDVLRFLLHEENFSRSLAFCMGQVDASIRELHQRFKLRLDDQIDKKTHDLINSLEERSVTDLLKQGPHAFADDFQKRLMRLNDRIGESYFGHEK
mgnify:CR=1 FL=1